MKSRSSLAGTALCWSFTVSTLALAAETSLPVPPPSPAEALQQFVHDPALRVELVASEPEIRDPVAIAFGGDGTLWVVELRDYPYGPQPGEPPQSCIQRLTDRDGDGRYETAVAFAENLLFVTGVLPYRDGLIVTLAGQIAFFADRDGDGKAEHRETWFSGFAQENSQLRANHPTFGPDGFVYVANGLRGGKVVAVKPEWKKSDEPLTITGFDFRFHPETGEFSTVTGQGQFGMSFDDYGRRFVCTNRNPCLQILLDNAVLQRNPRFGAKAVTQDVCAAAEKSTLYPLSRAWTTSTLHANQFTAACGVTIYRGDALPANHQGAAFTCDPTGNLVHGEQLQADGPTFAGTPLATGKEFLASPNIWFRPVNLAHGPDGALYVVDMCRAVIEHPDFMPAELKTRPDLLAGRDRGRIWRMTSANAARKMSRVTDALSAHEALTSSNAWARETAVRWYSEHPAEIDRAAIETLVELGGPPAGRVAALAVLQQAGQLSDAVLMKALGDSSPHVREVALKTAEPRLKSDPAWGPRVVQLAGPDSTARLRYQALLASLWFDDEATAATIRAAALQADDFDPWMRAAISLSLRQGAFSALTQVTGKTSTVQRPPIGRLAIIEELAILVGEREPERVGDWILLDKTLLPIERWSLLRGLAQGAARRKQSLVNAMGENEPARGQVVKRLSEALQQALQPHSNSEELELRLAAIKTVVWMPTESVMTPLLEVVGRGENPEITLALLETLAAFPQAEIAPPLLDLFPNSAPAIRRAMLDVLLASEARIPLLLDALDAGSLKAAEIDPVRQARLQNHRNPAIKQRATALFQAATADRAKVLADYQPVLELTGDPLRGKAIFEKQCVTCHRIGAVGVNVGPDIGDTRDKTPATLMLAILDPNRAVDNNSFAYTVVSTNGKVYTGLLTAETTASVTIRQPEGKNETLLRSDIEELRASGQSLMPVGFEKNISPDQMADLLSFLKNWRYLDSDVPASVRAGK